MLHFSGGAFAIILHNIAHMFQTYNPLASRNKVQRDSDAAKLYKTQVSRRKRRYFTVGSGRVKSAKLLHNIKLLQCVLHAVVFFVCGTVYKRFESNLSIYFSKTEINFLNCDDISNCVAFQKKFIYCLIIRSSVVCVCLVKDIRLDLTEFKKLKNLFGINYSTIFKMR